jgi:hypothetical protein
MAHFVAQTIIFRMRSKILKLIAKIHLRLTHSLIALNHHDHQQHIASWVGNALPPASSSHQLIPPRPRLLLSRRPSDPQHPSAAATDNNSSSLEFSIDPPYTEHPCRFVSFRLMLLLLLLTYGGC